jgi:hypothetical protein
MQLELAIENADKKIDDRLVYHVRASYLTHASAV